MLDVVDETIWKTTKHVPKFLFLTTFLQTKEAEELEEFNDDLVKLPKKILDTINNLANHKIDTFLIPFFQTKEAQEQNKANLSVNFIIK